jgi:D-glycero-D-manno-heptose 1,7-bisphosphate phosphatase
MSSCLRRAVFLDRDGVLNEAIVTNGNPLPPAGLEDLRLSADAPEALARLRNAGFLLICVTNQPDVARGTQRKEVVEAINHEVRRRLCLDEILTCYHDDCDGCDCRKPRPGLLLAAAHRFAIELRSSFLIGDRWKDIEAGREAGCLSILVGHGYGEMVGHSPPDRTEACLSDAVRWILSSEPAQALRGGSSGTAFGP